MKKLIKAVLLFMCFGAFVFFLFAFSIWEINPAKWSDSSRVFLSFCFMFGLIIFPMVLLDRE